MSKKFNPRKQQMQLLRSHRNVVENWEALGSEKLIGPATEVIDRWLDEHSVEERSESLYRGELKDELAAVLSKIAASLGGHDFSVNINGGVFERPTVTFRFHIDYLDRAGNKWDKTLETVVSREPKMIEGAMANCYDRAFSVLHDCDDSWEC